MDHFEPKFFIHYLMILDKQTYYAILLTEENVFVRDPDEIEM